MNSVILIGRLTRDPELSYTPNTQAAMCRFTIAVDRPRRNGEDQGADFIRITVWDRQAENCNRYLSKGSQVAVHGRIQTGSYKNREGVTVYTTDVVADRFGGVEFLGSRSGQGNQGGGQGSYNGGRSQGYDSVPSAFDAGAQGTPFSSPQNDIGGFDDLPDTFQAAEDDIPF
jgi:single-strand DNA-binding protein